VYLLRVGRQRRWGFERDASNPDDVAEASLDLQLAVDEDGLSVYRVEDETESLEVAVRWALTCRSKPQPMDYVVFPSELASDLGLTVAQTSREELDPFLNARHYEITGLTPELGRRLAQAILGHAGRRVVRVKEKDLPSLGAEICRGDSELKKYLKREWAIMLGEPAREG
jgi:hypothetical protein